MTSLIQAQRILKTGGHQNNLSVLIQPPTPKMGKQKQVLSQEDLKNKFSMCYGDATKNPKHKKNKKIKPDKVKTKGLKKKPKRKSNYTAGSDSNFDYDHSDSNKNPPAKQKKKRKKEGVTTKSQKKERQQKSSDTAGSDASSDSEDSYSNITLSSLMNAKPKRAERKKGKKG